MERLGDDDYLDTMRTIMAQRLRLEEKMIKLEIAHRLNRDWTCRASYRELGENLIVGHNRLPRQVARLRREGRLESRTTYRRMGEDTVFDKNEYDLSSLTETGAFQSQRQARLARKAMQDPLHRDWVALKERIEAMPEGDEREEYLARLDEYLGDAAYHEQRRREALVLLGELRKDVENAARG